MDCISGDLLFQCRNLDLQDWLRKRRIYIQQNQDWHGKTGLLSETCTTSTIWVKWTSSWPFKIMEKPGMTARLFLNLSSLQALLRLRHHFNHFSSPFGNNINVSKLNDFISKDRQSETVNSVLLFIGVGFFQHFLIHFEFFPSAAFCFWIIPYGKNIRSCSGKDNELKYLQFLKDITDDILFRGYHSNKILEDVFQKHIERNKHYLNEKWMKPIRREIEKLKFWRKI
ncbi:uncharacterized protein LOC134350513 isoform X2 [Mobula hypostoma]|uniref:uncharacterized protein LOC134350513 isoform X2 n=1 Tax=Mobula hypostoma TaxID=723540 RepID=UPI002FC2C7E3